MIPVDDVLRHVLAQRGDRYVFATEASPLDPDPHAFDCSELVEWACARAGVAPTVPDGAYYQWRHASPIPIDQGLRTRGALLFVGSGRGTGRAAIHHVAFSLGDGTTIEARGRRWGVGTWGAVGRFDFAGLIPGVTYGSTSPRPVNQGGGIQVGPGATSQATRFIQSMLNIVRAAGHRSLITVDGVYGNQTKAAVAEFQRDHNALVPGPGPLSVTGAADPLTCSAIGWWVQRIMGGR